MKELIRRVVALGLCGTTISFSGPSSSKLAMATPPTQSDLRGYLQKSYLELFELAPTLTFTADEMRSQRKALDKGKDSCVSLFKNHAKQYDKQLEKARSDLKKTTAKLSKDQRKQAHCSIRNLDLVKSEAETLATQAIPTAYDNLNAKLDLVEQWPGVRRQIQQQLADGSYAKRRWADVQDIGFREIEPDQQDDIKRGQQAIEEMKRAHLLPPEEDRAIQDYVNAVAQRVASRSDLKVPMHVVVLQSREINAFALPGGWCVRSFAFEPRRFQ